MQWFVVYALAAALDVQAPTVHDWRSSGADPCACTDSMPFIIGTLPPVDTPARVEALVADASSSSCRTARVAVEALRDAVTYASATEALVTALSADACAIRATAAWSLMKHARARAIATRLITLLRDPDRRVQQAAASALAIHGDDEAVDGLMELLTHSSKHVRQAAASTLGRLRAGRAEAVLATVAREDREPHVRQAAWEALRRIRD